MIPHTRAWELRPLPRRMRHSSISDFNLTLPPDDIPLVLPSGMSGIVVDIIRGSTERPDVGAVTVSITRLL